MRLRSLPALFLTPFLGLLLCGSAAAQETLPGFVIHFDFIRSAEEGCALVGVAQRAGAKVVVVVPPARVWDRPRSLAALDAILAEVERRGLKLVFTRIDAAWLPEEGHPEREYYLYDHLLRERGRLPDGQETVDYFLTTVGVPGYAEWMEEETRFYARRYGKLPNLLGIDLGPFSEPFSAERCGFLEYSQATDRYEVTQYTVPAAGVWHRWLARHFASVAELNREYGTTRASFDSLPLPRNEQDPRFGRADLAFFDFVRCLGDWYRDRYERCRRVWHQAGGRADVPFILQFSGFVAEKLAAGRPAYVAFDLPAWIAAADAVGLSVYTHSGYPDLGHASLLATVQLLGLARDLGKPVFVLEGGNEAPNVVLDPEQLAFFGSVARPLAPRTYVYEFQKDKFNESYASNPGKLVAGDGQIRPAAFEALKALFQTMETSPALPLPAPRLCLEVDVAAARKNPRLGALNAALFEVASVLPLRWVPKDVSLPGCERVPTVRGNGRLAHGSRELEALLAVVPAIGSSARQEWTRQLLALLAGS
jgi:hypothetical protein